MESWYVLPNLEQLVSALEQAYNSADSLAEQAREHALTYDIDRVVSEYLGPALELAADRAPEGARL